MATRSAEIDNALNLLKKLIEKRPEDPRHRLRLLTLLHANRRKTEYLEEALRYRAHCDLTFDTGWAKVCEMGREIDPGNGFFGKAPANHNHKRR